MFRDRSDDQLDQRLRDSSRMVDGDGTAVRSAIMNYLLPAQASAQLFSLIALAAISGWYVVPWLNRQTRADALIALLWVHVGRYVALQVPSAQATGFPISDRGAMEIVVGDVAGAILALVAIALLRYRVRLGIALAWLLAAETVYDTIANIRGGVREHLMGAATGVTWMILCFFVPAVVVSAVLLIGQLLSRRSEALSFVARDGHGSRRSTVATIPPLSGSDGAVPRVFTRGSHEAPSD